VVAAAAAAAGEDPNRRQRAPRAGLQARLGEAVGGEGEGAAGCARRSKCQPGVSSNGLEISRGTCTAAQQPESAAGMQCAWSA
jgi:hypothetical protein